MLCGSKPRGIGHMVKSATKPKALVSAQDADTDEEVGHSEDTLVTDHDIPGLRLHHDFDGVNQTFNGTLEMAAGNIAFEATFNTNEAWDNKVVVRDALISGSVYTDEGRNGQSAAGHIAMNASFKRLLTYVMSCLTEQEEQTAE